MVKYALKIFGKNLQLMLDISEMIKIAENNPKILQMELDFIEGNSRARALYEKMGFRITGINFNAIRQKDGTLCNEYSMIREINR